MAGQDTLILVADYNAIQTKIATVLGTGSANFGYGQVVSSAQVAPNAKISVTQWSNLRSDIANCTLHQTGVASTLTVPTTSTKVTEATRAAYMQAADDATTNRLVAPAASQATREYLSFGSIVRTASWNGVRTQTVTINFASASDARYFFNTGSRIEISASLTNTSSSPKDQSWVSNLSGIGVVYFNYDVTTATGGGAGTSIGWYDLTTSNQLVYEKAVSSGYIPNTYKIYARAPSSSQLVFDIEFRDDATSAPSPNPPWDIDEDVTGTLTSDIKVYRSSGSAVTVPLPPATSTGIV
jgi:hypothetical protein